MNQNYKIDYYAWLGLPHSASRAEIWKKIRLERQTAQKVLQGNDDLTVRNEARRKIGRLDEAIKILLDDTRRKEYDLWLRKMLDFEARGKAQLELVEAEKAAITEAKRAKQTFRRVYTANSLEDALQAMQDVTAAANRMSWLQGVVKSTEAQQAILDAQKAHTLALEEMHGEIFQRIMKLLDQGQWEEVEQLVRRTRVVSNKGFKELVNAEATRLLKRGKYHMVTEFLKAIYGYSASEMALYQQAQSLMSRQQKITAALAGIPGLVFSFIAFANFETGFWDIAVLYYWLTGFVAAVTFIGEIGLTIRLREITSYLVAPFIGAFVSLTWPLLGLIAMGLEVGSIGLLFAFYGLALMTGGVVHFIIYIFTSNTNHIITHLIFALFLLFGWGISSATVTASLSE